MLSQRGLKVRLGERGLVIWGRMGSLRLEAMRPLGGEAGRCIFVNEKQKKNQVSLQMLKCPIHLSGCGVYCGFFL